jgi:RNA polymerase sigma-70 factor (ECF subfamily)
LLLMTESPTKSKQDLFTDQAMPYLDGLYGAALKKTNNRAAAEDLVQETFQRAWGAFDRFEQGTNIKAWLFKILENAFINHYRKAVKEPFQNSIENMEEWQLSSAESRTAPAPRSAEAEAIDRMPDSTVKDALQSLPEEFRLAVYLVDVEGFSYKELAETLDIPTGTVMSRLHRGRKLLREMLAEYAGEQGYKTSETTGRKEK